MSPSDYSKQEYEDALLAFHSNECNFSSMSSSTNSKVTTSSKYSDSSGSSSVELDRWNTPNTINTDLYSIDWSNSQLWSNNNCGQFTESSIHSSNSCSGSSISSPEQFLSCSFSSPQSMTSPCMNQAPTHGYTSVIVDTQQYVNEYAVH